MGAWGHESFDNDDALDWIAELEASAGIGAFSDAFNRVIEQAEEYIEAPECSMAIAAAEVAAALGGKPCEHLPDEIAAWIDGKPPLPPTIIEKAHRALDLILGESELHELWEENEDSFPKWLAAVKDLKSRLE